MDEVALSDVATLLPINPPTSVWPVIVTFSAVTFSITAGLPSAPLLAPTKAPTT